MKSLVYLRTLFLAITLAAALPAIAAPKTGFAKANGIDYYYEISGSGEPLLLLHGGLGSIDMFRPVLPTLTEHRTVIGVDLQGHGRTLLGTREIDLRMLGRDMAVVLKELGFKQVDVLGYSFGGGVAFQLAAQHPDHVRRLAIVSAGYADDGFYPAIREQQKQLTADAAGLREDDGVRDDPAQPLSRPDDRPVFWACQRRHGTTAWMW